MKLVTRLASILAFASTLAACDAAPPVLPDCPVDTHFAPCSESPTMAYTPRATCWTGEAVYPNAPGATTVVGCAIPSQSVDECVAECVPGEGR